MVNSFTYFLDPIHRTSRPPGLGNNHEGYAKTD